MAGKKKTRKGGSVSVSSSKKKAIRSSAASRRNSDRAVHQILPYLFVLGGVFLILCLFFPALTGVIGSNLRSVTTGLFGAGAFCLGIELILAGFFWRKDVDNGARGYKLTFGVLVLLTCTVLLHLWHDDSCISYDPKVYYQAGQQLRGGGVLGGLTGSGLLQMVGPAFSWIIAGFGFPLPALFYVGLTPRYLLVSLRCRMARHREQRCEEAQRRAQARSASEEKLRRREEQLAQMHANAAPPTAHRKNAKNRIDPNIYSDDVGQAPFSDTPVQDVSQSTKNADASDAFPLIDQAVFDEAYEAVTEDTMQQQTALTIDMADVTDTVDATRTETLYAQPTQQVPTGEIDLSAIFANSKDLEMTGKYDRKASYHSSLATQAVDITLQVEREPLSTEEAQTLQDAETTEQEQSLHATTQQVSSVKQEQTKQYRFPPVSLLQRGTSDLNLDTSAELQENAQKLVQTLESFHVHTRITNVSRGPTITRYELAPEAGTRVRAIANLVDDIALNLAAPGVRIEAPIPGKSAVGVEVPNRVVSTVYLRDLIDSDTFRAAKSRLTACLGRDVAGAPVYFDVAKMPHLLICGATGMGKSVCINSVLMSLLYKATPEEMKLILVDPKKVELNIYNGIPHLLVPVVSDPKKAAGALHWAVTEMERRFELIEDVGMRDLKGYNEATEQDPDREHLSQIVIVIDELADLMMTAPDDVEESICRLAQKARAAGMHLIIGTQRPSVDVITGLIKANVPSRIAFKVSSQMDSRVVLDIAGAEKLIGRGDMLFAPVGASKPQRVQGAFVSEKEIDAVIHFLKKHAGGAAYQDEVMQTIEKEAQLCGQKKRGGATDTDGMEDEDPMLPEAIALAVESGKISTSLLQRRLSLGYGRAAKLVDCMERMGIVSPPDGQKPRAVLITPQQWMERKLRQDRDPSLQTQENPEV